MSLRQSRQQAGRRLGARKRATRAPSKGQQQAHAISEAGGVLTHRQVMFVLVGLMAAMFLSSLNQTVVGTAMRTIADDLGGLSLQAWVTTAFLVVSTISTPIYGKLSDIFGRRPLFIIAIVIFLVGSLLCGFANDMYQLAAYRAVQGLGAGGLMALPLTVMGDILAPRERARYQGYFLAVFGVSSVIGPLIGGVFAGADELLSITGWRWVFLLNLPIGIGALLLVMRFLHIPHNRRPARIDWWGAMTVVVGLVPLLLVAEQGREWGWGSAASITCYVVGALGIAAFLLSEKLMGDDALIPLKLFRSPTFSMATVLGLLVGFGMFGALMSIPLYLQLVNGATPTEGGFLMLPMVIGMMVASIGSGQLIARSGKYRIYPILGTGVMAAAFCWLMFATADKPVWFVMVGMLAVGTGLGLLMQTLTLASQNAVGARDIGVATSSATFFRQIGGTLGTAIIFSVLFTRIPETIAAAFGNSGTQRDLAAALADPAVVADPANDQIVALITGSSRNQLGSALEGDSSFLIGADPRLAAPFLDGFAAATSSVFLASFVVLLVAFVLSFFLKTPALREKSALQENAEQSRREDAPATTATVRAHPGNPTSSQTS